MVQPFTFLGLLSLPAVSRVPSLIASSSVTATNDINFLGSWDPLEMSPAISNVLMSLARHSTGWDSGVSAILGRFGFMGSFGASAAFMLEIGDSLTNINLPCPLFYPWEPFLHVTLQPRSIDGVVLRIPRNLRGSMAILRWTPFSGFSAKNRRIHKQCIYDASSKM